MTISWTYTITRTLPERGSYDVSADFAPFVPGSWTFDCTWPPYRLDWKEVTTTIEISGGSWSCRRSDAYCASVTVQLVAGQFPPTATGYQAATPNQNYYEPLMLTFSVELQAVKTLQLQRSLSTPLGERFAARTIVQIDAAVPNDVRLYFPSSKQELWSSVAILSAASPYFKTLFSSGFTEAEMKVHAGTAEQEDVAMDEGIDEEDSDAETDRTLVKKVHTVVGSQRSSAAHGSLPFHDVIIEDTSFTTYRSVLVWIYSRHIAFAPLTSKFGGDRGVRLLKIEEMSKATSHLPLPASPKSVYRLAHYLKIEELQEVALASIKSQINVDNVAWELFSNVGRRYREVEKIEMEFAVANWAKVKGTEGMKEVQRLCEAGEDPAASPILARLVMRLQ